MSNRYLLMLLLGLSSLNVSAQFKHQAYVETGLLIASGNRTPFWLRANQFGIVPYSAPIGTLRAGINGSFLLTDTLRKSPKRTWVVNYGAEAVGNAGRENQLLVPDYYIQLTHRQIQLEIGRRRDRIGLVDSTLTSGSYAWSGNALPIPKIRFGTKGFAPLGRKQWLAINAFIAHGWFANTNYIQHSFLHQKSVIFRIGKPTATVHAYAGINHHVQWGGHSDSLDYHYAVNGDLPSQLRDFPNVLFAIRTGGLNNPRITSFDYTNLYGNHVGSIDLGLEVTLPSVNIFLYHQHSFDDASGVLMRNIPDGLTGLRFRPVKTGSAPFQVNALLLEFLSTMDQSGPVWAPWLGLQGNDTYFNNTQYKEGWVYRDHVIGTPFITRKQETNAAHQFNPSWAISNNRIQMAHVGMQATINRQINLLSKVSYSRNYGTFDGAFRDVPTQWSVVTQLGMPLSWLGGARLEATIAADFGQLYTDTIGGYVSLRKMVWGK